MRINFRQTLSKLAKGICWVAVAGLLVVPQPMPQVALAAPAAASGPITGFVYNDYNSNGVRDIAVTNVAAIDDGVAGALVTAYDSAGAAQGTATTDASGAYSLTPGGNGPYRIEFTNLPAGYYPSRQGSGNGTSTQFVSAPATNVNFGILKPCDYCQDNPFIAGSFFRDSQSSAFSSLFKVQLADIYKYPYSTALAAGTIPRTILATGAEVGAVFGVAWQRSSRSLFASAYAKYGTNYPSGTSPLGPAGLGGIYRYDGATNSTSTFIDLDSVAYFGAGSLGSFTSQGQVGKVGLGGVKLSTDEKTLYVMDLFNKRLLAIPINDPPIAPPVSAIKIYAVPTPPNCPAAGDVRPFAVGVKNDKVYIGVNCSNESVRAVSSGGSLLAAYVYELDPASGAFTLKVSTPFTYNRIASPIDQRWTAWGTAALGAKVEPMLSDIEFDGFDMLLGIRGRNGDTVSSNVSVGGETLRACAVSAGTWQLEANGSCGANTVKPYPSTSPWFSGSRSVSTLGPGGGEWYWEDDGFEGEGTQGGLAQIPGYRDVIATQIDGVNANNHPGFFALNNKTGAVTGGRDFANAQGYWRDDLEVYLKSNNMGDLTPLCDPAPIEVGNRVWQDLNGNGIQDAGEPGLNGVTVSLQGPSGPPVTTVTSGDGNYAFNNLTPNTAYVLTINPSQAALTGLTVTAPNQAAISGSPTSNDPFLDTRDSDATAVGGVATINYTTGTAGQNNHGLDFGFAPPTPTPTPTHTPLPPTATPTNTPVAPTPTNTPVAAADLALTKTASVTSITSGVPFNYLLIVVNNGPSSAPNVVITDQLPAGLTVNAITPSAGGSCTNTAGLVRCTWATLASGASASVTITVTP